MDKNQQQAKVYQFDPRRKRKLKSARYVSPEKKQLLRERKQSQKDRRNFYIGVAALALIIAGLTYFRLKFF